MLDAKLKYGLHSGEAHVGIQHHQRSVPNQVPVWIDLEQLWKMLNFPWNLTIIRLSASVCIWSNNKKSGGLSTDRYKLYPQPARERVQLQSSVSSVIILNELPQIITQLHAVGHKRGGFCGVSGGQDHLINQPPKPHADLLIDDYSNVAIFRKSVENSPSQPRWPRGRTCPRRTACSPRGCPAGSSSWPSDSQRWLAPGSGSGRVASVWWGHRSEICGAKL